MLLLPIKLLAVVLLPFYFILRFRLGAADGDRNVSWFLQVGDRADHGRKLLETSRGANTIRRSHLRGLALLGATPLVLLDLCSTILFMVHLIFPLLLTLFSPLWNEKRVEKQFYKLGRLNVASPRWL